MELSAILSGSGQILKNLIQGVIPSPRAKAPDEGDEQREILGELVRAGSLLSRELSINPMVSVLVEQSIDITRSDLACLYMRQDLEIAGSDMRLIHRRGRWSAPEKIYPSWETPAFIFDSGEAVVVNRREGSLFTDLLLHDEMNSGIALPVATPKANLGILILNSRNDYSINRHRFQFLDAFSKLAGGMLHNARMFQELKDYLSRIEALELYQENIFTSMTNLLITTDSVGQLKYFNEKAGQRFGLGKDDVGKELQSLFQKKIDRKILGALKKNLESGEEFLGVQGIYSGEKSEMDFSLNISPLYAKPGHPGGSTLLFTDQTRERELQHKVEAVTEDRRVIKDMFSRYLSPDLMQELMVRPETIKPGGEKKEATVMFADIRGYTSFSEGLDPEIIITILNEYFAEAVEIVFNQNGYVDKFIGDCLMAAWGVPLPDPKSDVERAVNAALQIQKLVASEDRTFFKGVAKDLGVGIGMHTGTLVAGNLGSERRMEYSVIGDTVNIAARLEGVAKPGEIIITQATLDGLDDSFITEARGAVELKGKSKPVQIFSVIGKQEQT